MAPVYGLESPFTLCSTGAALTCSPETKQDRVYRMERTSIYIIIIIIVLVLRVNLLLLLRTVGG